MSKQPDVQARKLIHTSDSEVTSHDVWLNSSDAKSVATLCSTSANSFIGRGIGFLHAMPMTTVQPYQAGLAVVAPWNLYQCPLHRSYRGFSPCFIPVSCVVLVLQYVLW